MCIRDSIKEIPEEPVRAGGFPQKLVDLPRRRMAQEQPRPVHLEPPRHRQRAEPLFVGGRRVAERVVVAQTREVVVAWIGVTAVSYTHLTLPTSDLV